MATGLLTPPGVFIQTRPTRRRWTCAEFHQMGDMGWFEGTRAMLIHGEILEMPGPNPPHAAATSLTDQELKKVFQTRYVVRNQSPLVLGLDTDPEPDLAVVPGTIRDYGTAHPTMAVLVVEISDSPLTYDLTDKAGIYAAGGIADYWVVDLINRRVVVFRDPHPDAGQPFGYGYGNRKEYAIEARVSPLAAPQAAIAVADLLP